MEVFPIGLGLFLMVIVLRLRSASAGFIAAMATFPLGATALIVFGGFNLTVFHAAFIFMLGIAYARHFISPARQFLPRPELSAVILLVLVFYSLLTSIFLPRLFEGQLMVFSLDAGEIGERVSPHFLSTTSKLKPSPGNISQPVYLIISTLVFLFAVSTARAKGSGFLDKSIFAAAAVNGTMGLLDLVGADAFLTLFKTAGYSFFIDAKVAGVTRIVGVFPEGSSMGAISATLFAYMVMRYFDTGKRLALVLAGLNLAWAFFSLSSTGFGALSIAILYVVLRSGIVNLSRLINPAVATRILLFGLLSSIMIVLMALFTDFGQKMWTFVDHLVFQKGSSLSALERGAWAKRGIEIGFETYGLGAGLGSTRANGLIAVLVSNIGVIGISLFILFLSSVLKTPQKGPENLSEVALYNAASAGIVTSLAAKLISGTTADPAILFMVFSAIAVTSRPAVYFSGRVTANKSAMRPQ